MKISGGLKEDDIVVGNVFDKYGSRNPLVRWIMQGFEDSLSALVTKAAPTTIHEVGCGEGYWVSRWNSQGLQARGSDFSNTVIAIARSNAEKQGLAPDLFEVRSIYDLEPGPDSADLLVCCEVMEHLDHPEVALRVLQSVAQHHVILSVPREPLWRTLNMARGKYLANLGNTDGHIQHWSKTSFIKFVQRYFDILEVRSPVPWTMLLCRVKS